MSIKDLLNFMQGEKGNDVPVVTVIKNINTDEYPWCNSAVLFSVKNGKGTLTRRCGETNDDAYYKSQLMLNGFPIVQYDTPCCPTCTGKIAAGYGIENIGCAELEKIRNSINSDYIDINTSAEILKPFLGLLDDGVYMLADVPHYPTDGSGKFFYDVPNELIEFDAYCSYYCNCALFPTVDSFPAYIYPTQSDKCINDERVAFYKELLKKSKNPPRAIAYHDAGFISALLDGHHKAVAAAQIGTVLNCLTIISGSLYQHINDNGSRTEYIDYSGISIPSYEAKGFVLPAKPRTDVQISEYKLIYHSKEFNVNTLSYPTVMELADIYSAGLENTDITDELINEWLADGSDESNIMLKYVLAYFMRTDKTRAFDIARKIISRNSCELPVREAYKVLLHDRSEQTEQLFIDYLVGHSAADKCWDIVNMYWD